MCKVTKRKVLLTRPPGLSQLLTRIISGDGLPGFPCAAVWNETSQIGHTTTYTWSSWDAQGCPCLCTKPAHRANPQSTGQVVSNSKQVEPSFNYSSSNSRIRHPNSSNLALSSRHSPSLSSRAASRLLCSCFQSSTFAFCFETLRLTTSLEPPRDINAPSDAEEAPDLLDETLGG